jgi:hypothetical protein
LRLIAPRVAVSAHVVELPPQHSLGPARRILIERHYRSASGLRGRYRRHTIQRRKEHGASQGAGMDA